MKSLVIALTMLMIPLSGFAASPDMSISSSNIHFSKDVFVAGEDVRVYIRVRNLGDVDISGYIAFYNGADLIDSSQVVTLVADGAYEEVWVDFTIPHQDTFNISAQIKGTDPQDVDPSNDYAMTPLYSIINDEDGDGIDDDEDNCPSTYNSSQNDYDQDGIGDACDDDDDNDGVDDDVEDELGTDKKDTDTDDDGIGDAEDSDPLNPYVEEVIPIVIPSEVEESTEIQEVIEEVAEVIEEVSEEADLSVILGGEQESEYEEDQTLLERSSGAMLNISPNASFVYKREAWKTYAFESLAPDTTYEALFWDFGDGTSSVQEYVSHEYQSPGTYQIKLQLVDEDGEVHEDVQEIKISFFHLANPFVQIILGLLLILLILSIATVVKTGSLKYKVPKKLESKVEERSENKVEEKLEPKKVVKKKAPAKRKVKKS